MKNLTENLNRISKKTKNDRYGHKSPVIWLTGLSGSGKTTIANNLELTLFNMGVKTCLLDGDNVRMGMNSDLGFSQEDRNENIRRIAEMSKITSESGNLTITSFISPFEDYRELAKKIIGEDFIEVYLSTPLSVCESRDPKGLYKKARLGEIKSFTGIDSPYDIPKNPNITIPTHEINLKESTNVLLRYLKEFKYIQ